ncbi:MAG TPA: urease accessory protein UreD [Fibrobacteria bacterium]|nr:urease accessory protein UreD [Fibrobacteria bacterium]
MTSGRTRIVRSRAVPPVRFVHPDSGTSAAVAVSSALGGGMLEGDDYRFNVKCGPGSSLLFAPQANTRVFPCPGGRESRQSIRGTVYANGLMVCGGDPVVPYAGSRFAQTQRWVLHPGARLVLIDWMTAGRLDRAERFAFETFESVVRVEDSEGKPLLVDSLRLDPAAQGIPAAEGALAGHASVLAVHGMGPCWESLHDRLRDWLRERPSGTRPRWMDGNALAGLSAREDRGFSLRAVGIDRAALEPFVAKLFELLSSPDWLGFDFWKRKY